MNRRREGGRERRKKGRKDHKLDNTVIAILPKALRV